MREASGTPAPLFLSARSDRVPPRLGVPNADAAHVADVEENQDPASTDQPAPKPLDAATSCRERARVANDSSANRKLRPRTSVFLDLALLFQAGLLA